MSENQTISLELHNKIVEDLKVQHRYMYDSMKDQNWRIIRWLLVIIAALIIIFAGYVFYQSQFDTYSYEQEAQYDTAVTTSVLNNGTGRIMFNGDESTASSEGEGQEDQQEQPDEAMPDM